MILDEQRTLMAFWAIFPRGTNIDKKKNEFSFLIGNTEKLKTLDGTSKGFMFPHVKM